MGALCRLRRLQAEGPRTKWCGVVDALSPGPRPDIKNGTQKVRPNSSRSDKWVFLAATVGALMVAGLMCSGVAHARDAKRPIWPTKEWQRSTPEEQGMGSKELADVVKSGAFELVQIVQAPETPPVDLLGPSPQPQSQSLPPGRRVKVAGIGFDSLLIVRHGKIVVEAYYAPYSAGIPHAMCSVTEAITSTLTAIASEEGLLDSPSHRVLEFFDRSSIANVDDRKESIAVQNLLDMTSGIQWWQPLEAWSPVVLEMEHSSDWVKFVLDRAMSRAPGTRFNYSDGNAHLLSAIITKLSKMSALEYANAKLFGSLGIKDVSWRRDPQGISIGGCGLCLEPRDMAKIGYLYLRNGVWEGRRLLPSAWIDKVSQATVHPHGSSNPELRYGNLFWSVPDKHFYMAAGSHGQAIVVFPDLDIVAVTTGSADYYLSRQLGYLTGDYGLADQITGSVKSETALPADAAGATLLANQIRAVSTEKPTQVGQTSKIAAIISGKVYSFSPNEINVKSLSLNLADPQPHYDIETYAGDATESGSRFTCPIGLDGLYRKGAPTYIPALAIRGVYASKGTWEDDHTFVIDRLILGQGPPERWTITFDGEKLSVLVKLLDGREITVGGEARR